MISDINFGPPHICTQTSVHAHYTKRCPQYARVHTCTPVATTCGKEKLKLLGLFRSLQPELGKRIATFLQLLTHVATEYSEVVME